MPFSSRGYLCHCCSLVGFSKIVHRPLRGHKMFSKPFLLQFLLKSFPLVLVRIPNASGGQLVQAFGRLSPLSDCRNCGLNSTSSGNSLNAKSKLFASENWGISCSCWRFSSLEDQNTIRKIWEEFGSTDFHRGRFGKEGWGKNL